MARSIEEKREYFKKWYNLNKEKCLEKSRNQNSNSKIIRKQGKCLECEKTKGIWAKGLCQACYSKMRRQIPEVKLKLKLHNDTKGKEARKKYLEKQPKKQPKKEPKLKVVLACKCGKKSIAKGLCRNCYQNKRYVKDCTRIKKEKITIDYIDTYKKVLQNVKKGMTIQRACNCIGIKSTATFYKNITETQKTELRSYKAINKITIIDDYD